MFKYLWIIILVLLDLLWVVAGVKEIMDDYVDGDTLLDIIEDMFSGIHMILLTWIVLHGIVLTVASLVSFCLSVE